MRVFKIGDFDIMMTTMGIEERKQIHELDREQLIDLVFLQAQKIAMLEKEIQTLKKDSTNSSKPPSTDQQKKRTQSLREKSGKKSGGQRGHRGITRPQVENPDEIIVCRPDSCEDCGTDLSGVAGVVTGTRQEVDIPPVQITVTEYQQEKVKCPCCEKTNRGAFPDTVTAPVQIGLNLKSFVVYLNIAHHIPFQRLTDILSDLMSVRISQGTVDTILHDAYGIGKPLTHEIINEIKKEKWVGSDETGTRVEGKTWWQWTWQNLTGTYYAIEHSRGYGVVQDHFGEEYDGTLIHDCWSPQNNTVARRHQHCHPHYLRDLQYCIDTEHSLWAYDAQQFLLAAERAFKVMWSDGFDPALRTQVIQYYHEQLQTLIIRECIGVESRKIQKRMNKHQDKLLTFLSDPDIPFHNNSSEQAIRNAKIHKKISGGFRSVHGAQRHAVLLSIIETCKKRNMDILHSLKLMFQKKLSFQTTLPE